MFTSWCERFTFNNGTSVMPAGDDPSPAIRFIGFWDDLDELRVRTAVFNFVHQLSPAQREALTGEWIASACSWVGGGHYLLHRTGLGAAISGATVDELLLNVKRAQMERVPLS